jgi:hypothetical protein
MAIPPIQNQIELLEQESAEGTNPLDLPQGDDPILDNEDVEKFAGVGAGVKFLVEAAQRVNIGSKSKEGLKEIAKQNELEIARLREIAKKAEADRAKSQKVLSGVDEAPEVVVTPDGETINVPAKSKVQVIEPANQPEGIVPTQVIVEAPQPPELVRLNLDKEKVAAVMKGDLPDRELIDIDFNNVRNAEDLDILTAKVQETFADEIFAAKRGVLSDAEVAQLARRMDIDEELLTRRVGTVYSAEQIRAAGLIVDKAVEQWKQMKVQLLEQSAQGVDDLVLAEAFKSHTELTSAYIINFKGAKAEAGRALRAARRLKTDPDGEVDIVALNARLEEAGGIEGIKNMARMIDSLDEAGQSKFFSRLGTANKVFKEAWISAWYSSVLSSPVTFSRALFGSIDMMLIRPADSFFGATIGRAVDYSLSSKMQANQFERLSIERGLALSAGKDPTGLKAKSIQVEEDFVDITESAIEISNMMRLGWDGLKAGARAFKSGEQVYGFGLNIERTASDSMSSYKFANPDSWYARTFGFVGKVNSIPQRGMMFVDEFAGSITYETELRRAAARRAAVNIRNGLSNDEAILLMADEITNPSSANITAAQEAAKEVALRADLGEIGNWMMKTRSQIDNWNIPVPLGTVNFGFLKTIINLEKNLLRHTPLSPLLGDVRADLMAGGARRQMALGRVSTGMSIAGVTYNLTLDGQMTGLGPSNYDLKKQMIDQDNWQPCSVKGGDGRYHSIAGLGPIASTMCIGATIAENVAVYGKPGAEENESLLAVTGLMFSRHLQEIPMLGQTGAFLELVEGIGKESNADRIADSISKFASEYTKVWIGGVVPFPMPGSSLLRQIERTLDPETRSVTPDPNLDGFDRHVDFLLRSWAVNTPMMSDAVKPRRNILGEPYMPITSGGAGEFVANSLTPFLASTRRNDPMINKYLEYSRVRGRPIFNDVDRTINNIRLSDNELSDLKVYMNDVKLNNVRIGGTVRNRVTLRDSLVIALQQHQQEADEGRFNGLATTVSGVIGTFKEAAWNDPRFRRDYPEAYRQIVANKIAVDNAVDPIRRRPLSSDNDDDVLDLRELLEPTR